MDTRRSSDREFLQFYALSVNRALLELQSHETATPQAIRRSEERILEIARRLYWAYRIWKGKTREFSEAEFQDALLALLSDARDVFLDASG